MTDQLDLDALALELAELSRALRSASLAAGRAAGVLLRRRASDQLSFDLGPGV